VWNFQARPEAPPPVPPPAEAPAAGKSAHAEDDAEENADVFGKSDEQTTISLPVILISFVSLRL
jgi:hypothetical protein